MLPAIDSEKPMNREQKDEVCDATMLKRETVADYIISNQNCKKHNLKTDNDVKRNF
jgi:hypothetical protein